MAREVSNGRPRHLEDVLRAAGPLDTLMRQLRFSVDPQKRIDEVAQFARYLVAQHPRRSAALLTAKARERLWEIARAGGTLSAKAPTRPDHELGGFAFFVRDEMIIPTALYLELEPWPGEHPRSLRNLMRLAPLDTKRAWVRRLFSRTATPPYALAIEPVWETLFGERRLKHLVEAMPKDERDILIRILERGGEVDEEELVELEGSAMRIRAPGSYRRGASVGLEHSAMLFPLGHSLFALPMELRSVLRDMLPKSRNRPYREEPEPLRARYSEDPAPRLLRIRMACSSENPSRSERLRVAHETGETPILAAFYLGLWAHARRTQPATDLTVGDLSQALFDSLLDPTRPEDSPYVPVLRDALLEQIETAQGWVRLSDVMERLATDPRFLSVRRRGERLPIPVSPVELLRNLVHETLFSMGLIDLAADEETGETLLRPSARLRSLRARAARTSDVSRFRPTGALELGGSAPLRAVLALAPFAETGRDAGTVVLHFGASTLEKAIWDGHSLASARRALLELASPIPPVLNLLIEEKLQPKGHAQVHVCSAVLFPLSKEVREELLARVDTRKLFILPSPEHALLVQPGVRPADLAAAGRIVGIAITAGET